MKKCILHLLRMHSDACCREKTNLSNKIINFAANSFKTVVFTFHVDTESGCFDIHAYTDFLFSKTMREKMSIKWNKVHSNHLGTHANSKDLKECTSHCTVIMHTPSHTHISQQTGGLLQKITSMHIHIQSHACNHTHMHTSEAKHSLPAWHEEWQSTRFFHQQRAESPPLPIWPPTLMTTDCHHRHSW